MPSSSLPRQGDGAASAVESVSPLVRLLRSSPAELREVADVRVLGSEGALWLGVVGVGLAMRLVGLAAQPLTPGESALALQAWSLWEQTLREPLLAGPAFVHLLTATMFLFTPSDLAARAPAALCGLALVVLAWGLRGWIGGRAALAAGFLLAVSPLAVLASRTVSPAAPLMLTLFLLVIAARKAVVAKSVNAATAAAVALGLAVALDTAAVPQLIALAVAAAAAWGRSAIEAARGGAMDWLPWRRLVLVAGLTAALASTGLLSNPSGFQVGVVDTWLAWTADLAARSGRGVALILLYEAPLLLLGAVALVASRASLDDAVRRSVRFCALWLLLAALPVALAARPDLTHVGPPLVPLALLAGHGLAALAPEKLADGASWRRPLLVVGAGLVIALFVGLSVTMSVEAGRGVNRWVVALGAVALVWLVAVTLGWLDDGERRLLALSLAVALLLALTVAPALRLNHGVPAVEPARPVVTLEAARAVRERASLWARQHPGAPIVVDARLRPVLGWYLRELPVDYQQEPPAVTRSLLLDVAPTEGRYERRAVWIEAQWQAAPGALDVWRWWFHRRGIVAPAVNAIILVH